ncbi:sphingomyelinase C-like [Diadema antillarum]|uniref:sphingomyelinase C-like n=1 Tax=Diadema antillarum TaxID=105358 RepID=UPI003A8C07B3
MSSFSSYSSCDVDDNTPTVWLGDELDCQGNWTHCGHFGLDFVCENATGSCPNENDVLCASPEPVPLSDPTAATTLKVIAYNVWELRYLYYQTGQRERTCRIPRELFRLHPDVDVIVFNEVFMGGCFSVYNESMEESELTIRDILDQYGFIHYTETVGSPPQPPRKLENGGVFIASRWPILREDSFVYNESVPLTADDISGKGAVYVQIEKSVGGESKTYHVLGTHLQATQRANADAVRVAQATQMYELMRKQNIPAGEPVIYAGDLNARNGTQHGHDVISALHSEVPDIVGERIYTYDGVENTLLNSTGQSWIDYVLYSTFHLQPVYATLEVVRPMSSQPFDVCMLSLSPFPTYPFSERCLLEISTWDLADHYAVLGVFDFEEVSSSASTPGVTDVTTDAPDFTTDSGFVISSGHLLIALTYFLALISV